MDEVAATFWAPLQWALTMFPWGEAGTFLEGKELDVWQLKYLLTLQDALIKCRDGVPLVDGGLPSNTVQIATSSGHGVGKTALMCIILLWWMATRANPQAVVTAGTKVQLSTKTWRELKKWLDVCLVGHWFAYTDGFLRFKADREKWFAAAIPWSDNNPQAFAGTHERFVAYFFDEATTIGPKIWETSEGAFTTEGPHLWLVYSNPEDATGRFRECWTKHRKAWITFEVDARESALTSKEKIAIWKEAYGEDSDFFRVRVKGQFPRTGVTQFIPHESWEAAVERGRRKEIDPRTIPRAIPRLMGIDPAGSDSEHSSESVIVIRQGAYMPPDIWRTREGDQTRLINLIADELNKWKPDVAFIDAHGLGKGIYDALILRGYTQVVACYAGDKKSVKDKLVYYNSKAEWWGRMRDWLPTASIPDDGQLRDDLLAPRKEYNVTHQIMVESKDDLKLRGIPSPDTAEALSLTFAQLTPAKMDEHAHDVEPEVA